jgi:hypothetical protein
MGRRYARVLTGHRPCRKRKRQPDISFSHIHWMLTAKRSASATKLIQLLAFSATLQRAVSLPNPTGIELFSVPRSLSLAGDYVQRSNKSTRRSNYRVDRSALSHGLVCVTCFGIAERLVVDDSVACSVKRGRRSSVENKMLNEQVTHFILLGACCCHGYVLS